MGQRRLRCTQWPRGGGSIDTLSTVVDLTQNEVPVLVRQGKGKLDPALIQGIST